MKIIKYFFEFIIIISLFLIFKIVGLKTASYIGSLIGKNIGPLFRSKSIIKKNIKIAMGVVDANKENEIINNMWSNFGRTFAEYIFLKDFKYNKTGLEHIVINGKKHLDNIKKNNESVIFYSGHFANFELMAMELDKFGIKCAAIYRPLNNIFLNKIMERIRKKYICKYQIKKGLGGMKKLIQLKKLNFSTALMIDQRVSQGIKSEFFNQNALTTTVPAQLIKKFKIPIVPLSIERMNNIYFKIGIKKPIIFENEETTKSITDKLNLVLEKMIIYKPEQWIWSHNRWK